MIGLTFVAAAEALAIAVAGFLLALAGLHLFAARTIRGLDLPEAGAEESRESM